MSERPEPFLAERSWAHPSALSPEDVEITPEFDGTGRLIATRYSDGEHETYAYDEQGRLVSIEERPSLWATVNGGSQRYDSGGTLTVEHDDRGAVRITGGDAIVWERCDEPWATLLARGAVSLAERFVAAIAESELEPDTELYCLMLVYVGDGGLHVLVSPGTEQDRRQYLKGDDLYQLACSLWYPEGDVGFLEVDDDRENELLLREAALNDPREAQRTILTEVAKLLARRDWTGVFVPTDDFIVFIAEHDEGIAPKHDSTREVNPAERLAVWDARWPAGATRGEDELDRG